VNGLGRAGFKVGAFVNIVMLVGGFSTTVAMGPGEATE